MSICDQLKENEEGLSNIYSLYGMEDQLHLLQEECGELVAAVSHLFRHRDNGHEEFAEELCDVLIMAVQCSAAVDPDELQKMFDKKMAKLIHTAASEIEE